MSMPTLRLLPELEEALRQIPGVKAASVVTGPDAVPTEVHVLAAPGKPAKQVVRDVQSLAIAQYDIGLDHRIVSVVQIGDEIQESNGSQTGADAGDAAPASPSSEPDEGAPAEEPHGTRPSIGSIAVRSAAGTTEASVTLVAGDATFDGTASGPAGHSHRARIVAVATLEAVAELLGQPCEVETALVVPAGTREVALAVLTLTLPRTGEQVLTGSAPVRGDEADAVCRAVLAALNRQLSD
jgi:hypothetical protein